MIRFYELLKKNKKTLVYFPLAVYWLILLILTSLPSVKFVEELKISDKVEHLLAYFGLGVLFSLALHFQRKFPKLVDKYYAWSVLIISVYAMLDEIHQLFIPNRQGEVLDWLADFIGALIAAMVVKLFVQKSNEAVEGTN